MKRFHLLIILVCIGLFFGCSGKNEHEGCEHTDAHASHEGHDEESCGEDVVEVFSHFMELLGLKTEKVSLRNLKKTITIVGEIARDFEKPVHITSDIDGKVVKLKARLGDHHVKRGESLAVIEGEDGRTKEITSPLGCMIIGEHVEEGEEVSADTSLFTMADMSKLKASFDVYQEDLGYISPGQSIKVETSVSPGKLYPAKISFISPIVDGKTRAVKIRVDIDNFDCSLKLGMFLKGYITHTGASKLITIPGSAVQVWEGKKVVFIPISEDKYRMVEVELGSGEGGYIEVVSGVEVGDEVVSSGSFHLKSELRRRSAGDTGHGHAH